jgi:hypothetical protein
VIERFWRYCQRVVYDAMMQLTWIQSGSWDNRHEGDK